jgi:DNA polymerase-3 subunit gamma/tau
MQQYQNIARRYRPQNFSQVLGQESIVTILKNALRLGRVANAYLFSGTKGTGKTTLARIFAKALNCLNPVDQEPCNQCESCVQIQNHSSLDVIEIDGASNRGIDDIRQINETCGYAPAYGKYKIYIIDEVHMLTKEAFNALLKTLEEPPLHVKFFFATTEAHKVLPTILSRCQRFDLSRLSPELVTAKLKKIASDLHSSVTDPAFKLIAKISQGSLRDAESIFDQLLCLNAKQIDVSLIQSTLGIFSIDRLFAFDQAVLEQNYAFAFSFSEQLFQEGIDVQYFLETFLEHIRNHLSTLFDLSLSSAIYTKEQIDHYQQSKKSFKKEYCFYVFQTLMKQIESRSIISQIHLELFLLHLIEAKNRVTLSQVMQEIESLQHKAPTSIQIEEKSLPLPPPQREEPKEQAKIPQMAPPSMDLDTLIQFAAVELHGIVKK